MYLVPIKTAIVDALQKVFNSPSFVDPDAQRLTVSIEYPMDKQSYPSIWVNYEDQDTLTIAGIDHKEHIPDDPDDPNSSIHEVTRWMFGGEVTLTIVALTSLQRDNIYDQFVRVFAFSRLETSAANDFRTLIETNDFIGMNVNWDELRPHGDGASPGTPWGTEDEVIYEKSVGFDIEGEFVSDPSQDTVARLTQIVVVATDPDNPDEGGFVLGLPRDDA